MNTYNMNQYQQNHVSTASPEKILLMLYDGAIRFTRRAIAGIEENKPELRRSGISKALAIISEFSNSLNHEIGGEIAEDLDGLYGFMIRELTNANLSEDINKLKAVEKLLIDLRQTWGEAVDLNKKEVALNRIAQSQSAAAQPQTGQPATLEPDGYRPFAISR
jgi:flagellar protein FliS